MDESVRLYIERVKDALDIVTDEDLASELGYSKQAIANWRRRGVIPEKARERITSIAGPHFATSGWQMLLHEQREKIILYACLSKIFSKVNDAFEGGLTSTQYVQLTSKFHDLEVAILGYVRSREYHRWPEQAVIESLWEKIDTDRMLEVTWFFIDAKRIVKQG
jgi:Bacteriophage CI repressor helix-turn-helix domain